MAVRRLIFPSVMAVALMSGCHTQPMLVPLNFQIARQGVGAAEAGHSGTLQVRIGGFLDDMARRRVLATVADVDRVDISVMVGGETFTQTVGKAALEGGKTTAVFSGLPVGPATVSLKAFDAQGQVLAATSVGVTVSAGVTTPVNLTVSLPPTYVAPSPTGGSSGGGTTAPTGSVNVSGSLKDGPIIEGSPVPALTVLGTYDLQLHEANFAMALGVDAGGNAWVGNLIDGVTTAEGLRRVTPAGVVTPVQVKEQVYRVDFDPQGRMWLSHHNEGVSQYAGDGTPMEAIDDDVWLTPVGYVGPAGDILVAHTHVDSGMAIMKLQRYSSNGSLLTTYPDPDGVADWFPATNGAVAFDSSGAFWLLRQADPMAAMGPSRLVKYALDGTLLVDVPFTGDVGFGSAIAIDSQNNVWLTNRGASAVVQYSPSGTVLRTIPLQTKPGAIVVDASDHLWVQVGHSTLKLSPEGVIEGVAPHGGEMAAGSAGVWVLGSKTITLLAP